MTTRWFANKGQMLQLAAAGIACICAIAATWFYLKNDVSLFLFILVVVTAMLCIFLFILRAPHPSPAAPSSTEPNEVKPGAAEPRVNDSVAIKAEVKVETIKCAVGSFWEEKSQYRSRKIIIHEIVQIELDPIYVTSPEYEVEIEVNLGGSVIDGGTRTRKISANRYYVPLMKDPFSAETCSLFKFSFTETHASFFSIRVDHINPKAEEVSLSVCHFTSVQS